MFDAGKWSASGLLSIGIAFVFTAFLLNCIANLYDIKINNNNNNNDNDNDEMKLKCALQMIIDPRLKRKPLTPRPKVEFYGVLTPV